MNLLRTDAKSNISGAQRIRSRTSCETAGLPILPSRTFQVQNNRKPLRCQAMTVSGLTMISADLQSAQALDNHAQKTRSAMVNFGRFLAERRNTQIWCRSATISTWRAACERQTENIVERKGHRTLNIGLASQDFGKPNDLRKFGVSENHSAGMRSRLVDCVQNSVKPSSSLVASLGNTTEKRTSGMLLIY